MPPRFSNAKLTAPALVIILPKTRRGANETALEDLPAWILAQQLVAALEVEGMTSAAGSFAPFAERMRAEGLPDAAIRSFEYYYSLLTSGETGLIPESAIRPVTSLPDAETFASGLAEAGQAALSRAVVLRLNGGLGTSMGLEQPKSLLVVKNDLSFLDIIVRQSAASRVPLVLMNSHMTHADTSSALARYTGQTGFRAPLTFQQHKVPKITRADLSPARWPADPRLEWCPPGHGDLYTALVTSGTLDELLRANYAYAFVSNVDNLGAFIDTAILGYFVENRLPLMMEVADRTPADRKGGHLARRPDGRLVLRETAQCPSDDLDAFQDTTRHRFFNTNNLWLHLPTIKDLTARSAVLKLPMIRNLKTVCPRDKDSTVVYQLETAMASAVELFEGAAAVRVPRTRFAPVKTTTDLLKVRSDLFQLTDDFRVVAHPAREPGHVTVDLDSRFYGFSDSLDARFPFGPPSLVDCEKLEIRGDIRFGRGVTVRGRVELGNDSDTQIDIEDGSVIEG